MSALQCGQLGPDAVRIAAAFLAGPIRWGWGPSPDTPGSTPGRSRARRASVDDPDAMADVPRTQATDGVATYLGRGDPAGSFAGYYPA